MFVLPMEFATLGAECNKCVKGGGKKAEVSDVHAVEVEKTQERTQFPEGCGSFPIFDAINLDGVHGNAVFANDNTQVFNFRGFELALLWFEV